MREPNSKLTCDTHFAVGEGNWFSNFVMTCDMFYYENEIIKIKFFYIFFILLLFYPSSNDLKNIPPSLLFP